MKLINWYITLWADVFKYAPKKLNFWDTILWVLIGTSTLRVACIQSIAVFIFNIYIHRLDIIGNAKIDSVIQFSLTLLPSMIIDYFLIFYKKRYLNYIKDTDFHKDDINTKKRHVYRFAWCLLFIPMILMFLPIIIRLIIQHCN